MSWLAQVKTVRGKQILSTELSHGALHNGYN